MTDVVTLRTRSFRLVITGTIDEAKTALKARSLTPTTLIYGQCGTIAVVACARNVLSAWFAETNGLRSPFPRGTLVHIVEERS